MVAQVKSGHGCNAIMSCGARLIVISSAGACSSLATSTERSNCRPQYGMSRKNSPSSGSDNPLASSTAPSFSSALHSSGRLPSVFEPCSSCLPRFTSLTVLASRSHLERGRLIHPHLLRKRIRAPSSQHLLHHLRFE